MGAVMTDLEIPSYTQYTPRSRASQIRNIFSTHTITARSNPQSWSPITTAAQRSYHWEN